MFAFASWAVFKCFDYECRSNLFYKAQKGWRQKPPAH
jgi:hypothetical protein